MRSDFHFEFLSFNYFSSARTWPSLSAKSWPRLLHQKPKQPVPMVAAMKQNQCLSAFFQDFTFISLRFFFLLSGCQRWGKSLNSIPAWRIKVVDEIIFALKLFTSFVFFCLVDDFNPSTTLSSPPLTRQQLTRQVPHFSFFLRLLFDVIVVSGLKRLNTMRD